jgi:hypothetical protein
LDGPLQSLEFFVDQKYTQKQEAQNWSIGSVHMGIKEGEVKIFELYNWYAGFHL